MHKWFIALLILGAVVAMFGPLRMIAADRYARADARPAIIALAPKSDAIALRS